MMLVMVILLFGGVALGFLWRRGLLSILLISCAIAVGFGLCLGDWSFLHSASYFWRNAIYMTLTIGGYFTMVVLPTVAGTVAGYFLRQGICRR